MRNHLVYDVPTRLFHWIFAGLFAATYLIASTAEDSPLFSWHMLAGMTLVLAVLMRMLWGVFGTRHARFVSFPLGPKALLQYAKGLVTGENPPVAGHNPASSWMALVLMGLALALGASGCLMISAADPEPYEELHELMANSFLALVVVHIAGVVLHAAQYRDGFALSMVDGRKQQVASEESISGARPVVGLIFVAILSGFAATLVHNYDVDARTLNFLGTPLQLDVQDGVHDRGVQDEAKHVGNAHNDDD